MLVMERPDLKAACVQEADRGQRKENPPPSRQERPNPRQEGRDPGKRDTGHQAVHAQRRLLPNAEVPRGIAALDVDDAGEQRQDDDRKAGREERSPRSSASHARGEKQGERHEEVEPLLDREAPGDREELEVLAAEVLHEHEAVPVEAASRRDEQEEHQEVGREGAQPASHVEASEGPPRRVPQDVLEQDPSDQEAAQGEEELDAQKAEGIVGGVEVELRPRTKKVRLWATSTSPIARLRRMSSPRFREGSGPVIRPAF